MGDQTAHSHEASAGERAPDGLWRRVWAEGAWWDWPLLAVVPVVLLVLFGLPTATKRALALEYTSPTLLTAFASHFVHFSLRHLLTNVVGGALVVPTAYLLSVLSGRRRQFLAVFACFVLAFPFALSGLNLLFVRSAVGVGFSGIVLAFVGYLGIALMDFVGAWYGAPVDGARSEWLFFLGVALVAFDVSGFGPPLAVAALLGSLLFGLDIAEDVSAEWQTRLRNALTSESGVELAVFAFVVFVIYAAISVPVDPATASGIVNIYSHTLGFCLGYIVAYVTILVGGIQ
ncbi:MAG: hypothetical protein ABEJ05_02400 [Haloglomus sp.]